MNVGDLVRTIEGWSYKTWTGIIIGMEASEDWVKVLWTEDHPQQPGVQIFWAPVNKLESANAAR